MSPSWWYHEALAADRRAARRQLDLALSQQSEGDPRVLPARPVVDSPAGPFPPAVDWCYYEHRGGEMNDYHHISWMLVLLLMMGSATLTILLFIVLFVTGIIGGGA